MKKIISMITVALLTLLSFVPVYAAETIVDKVPGNTDISVYAKYVDNTGFTVISTDKDGNGSIILPDGTEIMVSGADSENGRIVVEEITDREVLDWIAEKLGDKADGARTYHVYLLDDDGAARPTDGVKVTIKQKDASVDFVYAVSNEQIDEVQAAFERGITFTTNGAYFYALCSDSGNSSQHQTGFTLWIILIAAIVCLIFFIDFLRKKKKRSKG